MDFAVIEELEETAEAIHFSKAENIRRGVAARADDHKATRRREFATLMRSIKSLVRQST